MKIAVCHDYFNKCGGGERVVMTIAKALGADIYGGFIDWENTYPELKKMNAVAICKSRNQWKIARAFEKYDFSGYDLVICSGTWSITASKNHPSMWYCHSPARWLYNFLKSSHAIEATSESRAKKIILKSFVKTFSIYWKRKDREYVRNFDKILCNSENVRGRIKKCYGVDVYKKTSVVYPPIFTKNFRWVGQEDFYLSVARIDSLKRVDTIVKAFMKMPEKTLVVISGGPDLEKIKKLASGCPNIKVLGWVSERFLQKLIGTCISTLYIPVDEDFGMSPLESMAAGKPCIGVREGGLKETILHKKTGYLCNEASESEIIKAVGYLTPKTAAKMKKACIRRAEKFSERVFIRKITSAASKFEK